MFQNRFDEFYLTICKEVGGIEGFVKSFFDFLFRKTDFFYECQPGDKMGFPPGYSKQMITGIMEQFQKEHYKKFPPKSAEEFNKKMEAFKQKKQTKQIKDQKKLQSIKKPIAQIKKEKEVVTVEQKKQSPKKQVEPIVNTYNGGKNQKYSWSQQMREVEVTIEIENTLTSKNVNVSLKNDSVSITKKTGQTIVNGELFERINSSESIWKIQRSGSKAFIVLTLQKAQQKIWNTVFKGDPQIDTSKVNSTKPLEDFDEQTQGAIRKIMHQQKQKQMGLPTTEEEKQIDALKQAWNAQGSPFKGKPFDPSLINMQGSQFQPQ